MTRIRFTFSTLFLSIISFSILVSAAELDESLPRKTNLYDFSSLDVALEKLIGQNAPTTKNDSEQDERRQRIRKFLEAKGVKGTGLMGGQSRGITGFGILIVKDGLVVHEKAFGSFDLDRVVPIASASKMPSTLAILTLIDEGRIALDDPIVKYIPDWPHPTMTVRQTLSCTSGLGSSHKQLSDTSQTMHDCVYQIAETQLKFEPGSTFSYSGGGYQVAGYLATVVSGQSWQQFFAERIATPLGLKTFTYGNGSNPRVAGGASSNLEDYARLLLVHLQDGKFNGRQILSPKLLAEMRKDQVGDKPIANSPYKDGRHYGLSWWITPPRNGQEATEFSDQGMFGATPWIDIEHGYAAVILTKDGLANGTQIWNTARPLIIEALKNSKAVTK